MTNETHNGWRTLETWRVAAMLDNIEPLNTWAVEYLRRNYIPDDRTHGYNIVDNLHGAALHGTSVGWEPNLTTAHAALIVAELGPDFQWSNVSRDEIGETWVRDLRDSHELPRFSSLSVRTV